ncbi:MurR/RpiR family transcriptional regulator [Rhizobium sp. S95]|uniref:MurR/RpiR family transcriptional regulator n=1 Tax=Ciceribacter sichuanensis TaxID=2949647 RepID=A0AAJ1F894_9HYPH|nr:MULTISPECIES: MurR/RpiR family transcriptional regulator [unclassified Ciceribacter]MCM2394546.1 MurR/RpiR family transcriptional regulator [Ciceribacter sp. S95]MCM2402640.1 MurR/RpiR family transcriptional regulator [Ciceribacter sp. S153]MCO5958747.1 MurR/RpiR family transcriptional regulator [Ciceribacter sp. S101]
MTIKDRLTGGELKLTGAETRVVRTLLANYPSAGLTTVAGFAQRAGVSVPTVLRLVTKLGFSGYAAFQDVLIDEVSEKLNSPLSMFDDRSAGEPGAGVYADFMRNLAGALHQAADDFREAEFEAMLDLLGDERSTIYCVGGRSSSTLALRLSLLLAQVRPNVFHIGNESVRLFDRLADFNSQVTLVVFDYRRYQADVVEFAKLARETRARIVLFTDRWLSPISNFADRVLVSPVESLSAFDTRVVAFAQCEAIIAALSKRNPDRVRERLSVIEDLRKKGNAHLHRIEHKNDDE